jgi:hypothetical protein
VETHILGTFVPDLTFRRNETLAFADSSSTALACAHGAFADSRSMPRRKATPPLPEPEPQQAALLMLRLLASRGAFSQPSAQAGAVRAKSKIGDRARAILVAITSWLRPG